MSDWTDSFTSGFFSGLAVSAVWALIVGVWYWWRNWDLERKLRSVLVPQGISIFFESPMGSQSVGVKIRNPTKQLVVSHLRQSRRLRLGAAQSGSNGFNINALAAACRLHDGNTAWPVIA